MPHSNGIVAPSLGAGTVGGDGRGIQLHWETQIEARPHSKIVPSPANPKSDHGVVRTSPEAATEEQNASRSDTATGGGRAGAKRLWLTGDQLRITR